MFTPHANPFTTPPPALMLPLVLIFLVIYIWLVKYFVDDLYKPERRVAGGDKTIWLVVIIFGSVIGILAYLMFGRES